MDQQALEFMAKEMLTTDIDTGSHVAEMFIGQAQAGEDVAEAGALLIDLQRRYNMLPNRHP